MLQNVKTCESSVSHITVETVFQPVRLPVGYFICSNKLFCRAHVGILHDSMGGWLVCYSRVCTAKYFHSCHYNLALPFKDCGMNLWVTLPCLDFFCVCEKMFQELYALRHIQV